MNIQFNTFSLTNTSAIPSFSNNKFKSQNIGMQNTLTNDVFVKSANQVSFEGKGNGPNDDDLFTLLMLIGFVGAPIALAVAAAKADTDTDMIFLPDGTYLCDIDDLRVETDKVVADANEGILKIEGTPVDIDASRYDFADVEKGIYKNYDGSVDIDFGKNKYIDVENGVFIDPEHKIAVLRDSDGSFENIFIPDIVNHPAFHGSSMPAAEVYHEPLNRSEFIEKHNGRTPEELNAESRWPWHNKIADDRYDFRVLPDDNRSLGQKFLDAINFRKPIYNNYYDQTKEYDIWGREVVTIKRADGSFSKVAIDEKLQAVMDKYHLKEESLGEISDFVDKLKTKEYLMYHHPAELAQNPIELPSVEEFASGFVAANSEAITSVATDAVAEAVSEAAGEAASEAAGEVISNTDHELLLEIIRTLGHM